MTSHATKTVALHISQGVLLGATEGGISSFKGIPYAAPPIGTNRFQAPQPPLPWDGERDAQRYGPTAPKPRIPTPIYDILPEPTTVGEDYLNLNVWTPDPAAVGLAVFVWIHGGAFVNGTGSISAYDGSHFARDGVVCVSINYRLGADGFLLIDGAPANRGLLDQIAALEWVQANISQFGGDPERVTIGGESAGAMSVTTLMSMPVAQGLFHQAVAQSGAGHHVLLKETASKVAAALAQRLGVEATLAGFAGVEIDALMTAQAKLARDIAQMPDPAVWGELAMDLMPFEPCIDGEVILERPIDAISRGAGAGVTLLAGTNTDEHTLFLVPTGIEDMVNRDALNFIVSRLGADPAKALSAYESGLPRATDGQLFTAVLTDWFFRVPAVRLAEARGANSATTYMYEFAWRSPLYDGRMGAMHALEIGFVFDNLGDAGVQAASGPNPPQSVADEMHSAWVAFITSGDPRWPAYDDARTVQVFDTVSTLVKNPRSAERHVWDGVR